MIKLCGFL
jgi:hypothetical protein